jgi:hypothetical protein
VPVSRRPRPLDRSVPCERDARLIVIASEGEKTEERYFRIFRSTKIQLKLITALGGRSSPDHVLSNLVRFSEEFDLGIDDELWLVIDRDRWTTSALSKVAREVQSRGWGLALSNPCFEFWLALHFPDPLPSVLTSASLVAHLQHVLGGFNKTRFNHLLFQPHVRSAENRARALDTRPEDRWPQNPGSRIYKITEQFE